MVSQDANKCLYMLTFLNQNFLKVTRFTVVSPIQCETNANPTRKTINSHSRWHASNPAAVPCHRLSTTSIDSPTNERPLCISCFAASALSSLSHPQLIVTVCCYVTHPWQSLIAALLNDLEIPDLYATDSEIWDLKLHGDGALPRILPRPFTPSFLVS